MNNSGKNFHLVKNYTKAIALSAGLLLVGISQATVIRAGATGLNAPASTISFSEVVLSNNAVLNSQYSAYGVSSFSGLFYNGCTNCITTPHASKPDIGDFSGGNTASYNAQQEIFFTSALNGAAFDVATNAGTFTFTALLNGNLVEQFTVNAALRGYYGFSNISLNEIRIQTSAAMLLDNLQLGTAVPEPTTVALLGLGLLGFAASRRKSAKGKNV